MNLASVKRDELPEELRKLSAPELKQELDAKAAQRAELQQQANELSRKRAAFLEAEQKRLAAAGKGDSFDSKVAEILRAQAGKKGINY